jgi:hypothetical protein
MAARGACAARWRLVRPTRPVPSGKRQHLLTDLAAMVSRQPSTPIPFGPTDTWVSSRDTLGDVRYAPESDRLLRCRELSRWAPTFDQSALQQITS